jgi:hypothetical protein
MESELKDPILIVELVPRTCFFSNLRSNLSKKDWDRLRHLTIEKADHRCEICGSTGNGSSLECHEIWKYDDENKAQTLTGLIALCKACHRSKHMALARHKGWEGVAEDHLMRINDWDRQTLDIYLEEVFIVFERRSTENWSLDISWLEGFDVDIPAILDRGNH